MGILKRYLRLLLLAALSACLCACSDITANDALTVEKLKDISRNGDWSVSAFSAFEGEEIGSGLYIMLYDMDRGYRLTVSSTAPDGEIFTIWMTDSRTGASIDPRSGDIDAFINSRKCLMFTSDGIYESFYDAESLSAIDKAFEDYQNGAAALEPLEIDSFITVKFDCGDEIVEFSVFELDGAAYIQTSEKREPLSNENLAVLLSFITPPW